jgi:hypothetical protein
VIFKRKDTALKSFESIKKVKPSKLYIGGDGPRNNQGEILLVSETRKAILDSVDWDCEIHTLFQKSNLGCSIGVFTAINWLFDNEENGIIIEDDCVMRDSFFPFVKDLLLRYKNDSRVGMICGANYTSNTSIPDSYVFSRYKSCHGWATWKRSWKLMDLKMEWRNSKYKDSIIRNMGYKSKDVRYWKYRLKAIDLNDVSAWDWQWYFTLAANNMLAICPEYNLTSNIGFGEGATHTSQNRIPNMFLSHQDISFPLRHPQYVVPYQPFEKAFYHSNNTLYNRIKQLFPFAFKNMIKKLLRK